MWGNATEKTGLLKKRFRKMNTIQSFNVSFSLPSSRLRNISPPTIAELTLVGTLSYSADALLRETCHGILLYLLFSYSYFSLKDLWWILTIGRPVLDTIYSSDGGDLWWTPTLLYYYSLWQTCGWWTPLTLLNWWWRPVVTPTLLYSTLTLFGRPVVDTIYSFELMVETCGDTYSTDGKSINALLRLLRWVRSDGKGTSQNICHLYQQNFVIITIIIITIVIIVINKSYMHYQLCSMASWLGFSEVGKRMRSMLDLSSNSSFIPSSCHKEAQ